MLALYVTKKPLPDAEVDRFVRARQDQAGHDPNADAGDGRRHNHRGYTSWMCGSSVRSRIFSIALTRSAIGHPVRR